MGNGMMEEQTQKGAEIGLRILNRDVIKYIAMFTMLLNHIAHVFLTVGTPFRELLEDIGYFTAPVMCYFMVEGYAYTRSKVRYGLRLLLFAIFSQIPFQLVFGRNYGLNMIYTLFCCFLILVVMERVSSPLLREVLGVLLILATTVGDWAVIAPLLTILLANGRGDRRKTALGFGAGYVFFWLLGVQHFMSVEQGGGTAYAVVHAAFAGLGILAAAVVILVFYNGKRAQGGRNFSKWFFYIFYPAHLLLLYVIKMSLHNM